VELRHVEHVHLAHAMKRARDARFLAALTILAALRLIAGALLPLSADEAYYWLWSRHLAAGYFDHPPAIAYVIRAGTALFGATPFGVRVGGIFLSFVASWFVWRTGAILARDERVGAIACLFFNLTLMISVEMLAATPDAPSIAAAAAFCWSLAKVAETKDGRWWLAAGIAAGLGLLSKYSMFFLGLGAVVWLLASPMRRWLASPWPYLGGVLALILFAPNLWWNQTHGWVTFAFQFGRIEGESFTLRYLFEFLGAQFVLATPFILLLGAMGLAATRGRDERQMLIAAILWPAIAYFAYHSLHARVQGNWPCFLYPLFSAAAALAWQRTDWSGWRVPVLHWSKRLAVPAAALLLAAAYAQALFGVVPMGRKDPMARLLAVGFPEVAAKVEALRLSSHAGAVLTTDYASTAWFAFYGPGPVVQIGEDYRWPQAPAASAALYAHPALYVSEVRRDSRDLVAAHFAHIAEIARIDRQRDGVAIAHYVVYRVSGLKGAPVGRIP
jgi:4-amino-4-deoxy-L-arabinose transferase-like glycosyltransferase